jgi:hypothetical protein
MLDEVGVREIRMGTSQQFDGRWLVCYLGSGTVEIQGIESQKQAIEYIQSKPGGEFGKYVYVEREGC